MSEFQYYEFQTIERCLTPQDMQEIRKLSSRAHVSSNRAIFTYNFGDFRGNTNEILNKYFDAFVYVSNFGTKKVAFQLPTRLFKTQNLCPYEYEYIVEIEPYEDTTIVTLHFNNEEGSWTDEEDCANLLDVLLPLRQDLLLGDPRSLYLALIANQAHIKEKKYIDTLPVPPNLKNLTPALQTFVEFFEIAPDCLEQAISQSSDIPVIQFDLTHLAEHEKDAILQKILDNDPFARVDLQNLLMEKGASQQKL